MTNRDWLALEDAQQAHWELKSRVALTLGLKVRVGLGIVHLGSEVNFHFDFFWGSSWIEGGSDTSSSIWDSVSGPRKMRPCVEVA